MWLQVRDLPFVFPLSGGAVGNSRFLSLMWPLLSVCCAHAAGLLFSLGNKLLSDRNPHSGTGVTLLRSWQTWAMVSVGFFKHYQKAEREKNHQYLLKQWPKPRMGGDQMHTQMSWLNT